MLASTPACNAHRLSHGAHKIMSSIGRTNTPALLLSLILSALTLWGCPKDIPPPDNEIKDLGLLRAAVDARVESFSAARFKEVVLDYYGKDERIKVRQLILVRPPANLHIKTRLPGSDEVLNLLVTDENSFAMHQRDSNTYYTGSPTRENINRLLPVDLSAQDVVRVMLGGAPWDRFEREGGRATLTWDRKKGRYLALTTTRAGGTLSFEIRHTDFAVIEVRELSKDDKLLYHYTTDDWKRFGELSLPQYRRFVWPAKQLDFSLDVGETQVNIELPDTLFQFEAPAGSQIIQVDP